MSGRVVGGMHRGLGGVERGGTERNIELDGV